MTSELYEPQVRNYTYFYIKVAFQISYEMISERYWDYILAFKRKMIKLNPYFIEKLFLFKDFTVN